MIISACGSDHSKSPGETVNVASIAIAPDSLEKATPLLDSLITAYNEADSDSVRFKRLDDLNWYERQINSQRAIYFAELMIELAEANENTKWKGKGLMSLGLAQRYASEYESAKQSYESAIDIFQEGGFKISEASAWNNLANLLRDIGAYEKALEASLKSAEIWEKHGTKKDLVNAYSGLGNSYNSIKDFKNSLKYRKKAVEIANEIGDPEIMIPVYINLAISLNISGENEKALEILHNAYDLSDKTGNLYSKSYILANLGSTYFYQKDFEKAKQYWLECIEIRKSINDFKGTANVLSDLGSAEIELGNLNSAKGYLDESITMADKINARSIKSQSYALLAKLYSKEGNYRLAFENLQKFNDLQDSLVSDNIKEQIAEMQAKYDTKQAQAKSELLEKEAALKDAELEKNEIAAEKKNQQMFFLIGGLILIVFLAAYLLQRFRVTRRRKGLIENQRNQISEAYRILEEKNSEIVDSITYAKRIQKAILPPDRLITKVLPNSFIFYQPKDIVAGDFYWIERLISPTAANNISPSGSHKGGEMVLFAAADCTGHGVPGAMVSVVCNHALNRAVREFGLNQPAHILEKARELVIEEFEKSEEDVKDGMDIALCSLSNGSKLHYAGANNPLWIVRSGRHEIEEIKGDKQPIGKYHATADFTEHEISVQKGDIIYIFTDGFADQFGGEKGKKYKYKNFKKFLISICHLNMEQQAEAIHEEFERWKGNLEQLDDVCVIGVRL